MSSTRLFIIIMGCWLEVCTVEKLFQIKNFFGSSIVGNNTMIFMPKSFVKTYNCKCIYSFSSYKVLPWIILAFLIMPPPGALLFRWKLVISNNMYPQLKTLWKNNTRGSYMRKYCMWLGMNFLTEFYFLMINEMLNHPLKFLSLA